ncbi:MAG: hypothetical protein MZV49_05765 [Rhodopseudomonas palustris]|nr:hypothetical protein [Rhodopseudomonas palustris]
MRCPVSDPSPSIRSRLEVAHYPSNEADIYLPDRCRPDALVSRSYTGAMRDGPLGPGWSMDVAERRLEVRDGVVAVGPPRPGGVLFPAGSGYRSADWRHRREQGGRVVGGTRGRIEA